MSLSPQPSRVPIGTLADGTPVYVTREWQKYLGVELFARVGGAFETDLTDVNNRLTVIENETVNAGDLGANGNETDESAEIQAVIDALPATGGTVLVTRTYYATNIRLDGSDGTKSNVTLKGIGGAIKKPTHSDLQTDAARKSNVITALTGSGFRVQDLTLEGNLSRGGMNPRFCSLHTLGDTLSSTVGAVICTSLAGTSSLRDTDDRTFIVTALGAGVVSSAVNISFDLAAGYVTEVTASPYNETTGAGYLNGYYTDDDFKNRSVVYFNGTVSAMGGIVIENCIVTDGVYAGLLPGSGPLDTANAATGFGTDGARINGNRVYSNGATNIGGGNKVRATITSNIIGTTDSSGIRCDEGSHYCTISNNTIDCNDLTGSNGGVSVYKSDGVTVTGNTITRTTVGVSISISDQASVSGNTIYATGVGVSAVNADGLTVSSNILTDTSNQAIKVTQGSTVSIVGNSCLNNDDDAIEVNGTNNISIVANTVYLAEKHGIYLIDTTQGSVTGNSVRDCNGTSIANGSGIYCESSDDLAITANRCMDARGTKLQVYGLYVDAASSGIIAVGNVLANNLTAPTNILGANCVDMFNGSITLKYNLNQALEIATGGTMYLRGAAGSENFRIESGSGTIINTIVAKGGSDGTGSSPNFSVDGSTTNIDFRFLPKGTGLVRYGAGTAATVAAAFTADNYLTQKLANGTTIYIPYRTATW